MAQPSKYDRMRLAKIAAAECKRHGVSTVSMDTIFSTIDALAAAGWLVTPGAALPADGQPAFDPGRGMSPVARVMAGLDGPASASTLPPRPGEFCHRHFSWLCQAGQGQCQLTTSTEETQP